MSRSRFSTSRTGRAATQNIEALGLQARIRAQAIDLLDHAQPFPRASTPSG
jgi:hypothetical protein